MPNVAAPSDASLAAWTDAMHDPALRDLPYKIETNAHGQLVLSPHTLKHSLQQSDLYDALREHVNEDGRPSVEFAVRTSDGVKVPDVVWISAERLKQMPDDAVAAPVAPEICVEVRSDGNTDAEMKAKRALYIEAGADEVWICALDGTLTFYDADGPRMTSRRAPSFPTRLD